MKATLIGLFSLLLFCTVVQGQATIIDIGSPMFWDANTETDIADYGVYRSAIPCTDPTPAPVTCINFVEVAQVAQGSDPRDWTEPGPVVFVQDYYYRITARNTSGEMSLFSNELNVRWLNPIAPGAPGSLRSTAQGANMWLDWDDPDPSEHVTVWNIYKSTQVEFIGAHLDSVAVTDYRDNNPGRRGPRYYSVTAVNDRQMESDPAGPVVYVGRN